jgi:hypothetical protein
MTAHDVLRAYGLADLTRAEQRARVDVLGRMGALAPTERDALLAAGLLGTNRDDARDDYERMFDPDAYTARQRGHHE